MRPLRVAILGRRFWPLAGGNEVSLAELATGLANAGYKPRIVTAKPAVSSWPDEITYQTVPLTRLPHWQTPGLGALRYWIALYHWLRTHQDQLDVVLVSEIRAEAYIALTALQATKIPVVLRIERAGIGGDISHLQHGSFGSRIAQRASEAAAIITTSLAAKNEWITSGFQAKQLACIPSAVRPTAATSHHEKQLCRQALATINHDLALTENSPLIIAYGRMIPSEGFADLVAAWPQVLKTHPTARLWIVGDGPERNRLFAQVKDLGLNYLVLLPGTFDDLPGLITAADGWVLPSWGESPPSLLPMLVARGVPLVATDLPVHRERISTSQSCWLASPQDRKSLATNLCQLLTHLQQKQSAPKPEASANTTTFSQMITAYQDLLESLVP